MKSRLIKTNKIITNQLKLNEITLNQNKQDHNTPTQTRLQQKNVYINHQYNTNPNQNKIIKH